MGGYVMNVTIVMNINTHAVMPKRNFFVLWYRFNPSVTLYITIITLKSGIAEQSTHSTILSLKLRAHFSQGSHLL